MDSIPLIDIAPLFNGPSGDRARADREIAEAAAGVGFFGARGWPANLPIDPGCRAALLRIFQLAEQQTKPLWRRKFAPSNPSDSVGAGWGFRSAGPSP